MIEPSGLRVALVGHCASAAEGLFANASRGMTPFNDRINTINSNAATAAKIIRMRRFMLLLITAEDFRSS